jgi:hypothetical protein
MGDPDTPRPHSAEEQDPKTQDRLSEATSDKTVSDLEESEKLSDSKVAEPSDIPSPDGAPNPERNGGRADGSDSGGPM